MAQYALIFTVSYTVDELICSSFSEHIRRVIQLSRLNAVIKQLFSH